MSTSSGQNLTRRRALRNCARFIFLLFICVALNTSDAQSATQTTTKASTNSDRHPSTETAYEFTRPTFNQATKYIYEKVERLQDIWASDSRKYRKTRQESAKAHPSQGNTRTEHEAQQSVGRDQNQFDHSHPSSDIPHESLKFSCEATEDVWRMLNPSSQSFAQPDEQTEDDSVSVDEALEHIRSMIQILGRTHNAILEKKVAKLPLLQKLWVRYLHFYKDPYFAQNTGRQSAKFRKALFDLARFERVSDILFGNGYSSKDTLVGALTKQMSQSMSALKQSFHKAAHGGSLMTGDVHPYFEEATQRFIALNAKWLHKMGSLTEAARPISDRMPSHEQMQCVIKGLEDTMTGFKEELWRSRTEWMYQRGEALSWAKERTDDFKRRAAYESDRASENLKIYGQSAKQAFRGSMECSKEAIGTLLERGSEHTKLLIVLLQLWFNAVTRFLRNCSRLVVLSVSNSWRILAYIAVIILFPFLLSFVLADDILRSVTGRTISRSDANNSTNHGPKTTARRRPEILPAGSPNRSETSENEPKQKPISSEREGPPNTSKPTRVRGSTSPENGKPIKPRVQRRERRTVVNAGNDRAQKQTTPLQASNLHYQKPQTSLEKQMNGRPIHLGNHEVQLVYENVPRDDATDAQRNGLSAKRTAAAARTTGLIRSSRRGEKQPEAKLRIENSDDVITVHSSDESTTSYGSANSRLTRASLRRASARESEAR